MAEWPMAQRSGRSPACRRLFVCHLWLRFFIYDPTLTLSATRGLGGAQPQLTPPKSSVKDTIMKMYGFFSERNGNA